MFSSSTSPFPNPGSCTRNFTLKSLDIDVVTGRAFGVFSAVVSWFILEHIIWRSGVLGTGRWYLRHLTSVRSQGRRHVFGAGEFDFLRSSQQCEVVSDAAMSQILGVKNSRKIIHSEI